MREEDTGRNKNTVKNSAEQSSNRLVTDGAGDIQAASDDELADKLAGVSTAAESALSDYDLAVIGEAVSRLGEDQKAADPKVATDGGEQVPEEIDEGGTSDDVPVKNADAVLELTEDGLEMPEFLKGYVGTFTIRTATVTGEYETSKYGLPESEFYDGIFAVYPEDGDYHSDLESGLMGISTEDHPETVFEIEDKRSEKRSQNVLTDGGVTIESQFLVEATQLEDVSVSTEQDRFIVTIRGPADGVIDASPVIDLATEHGHTVGPVLADIETPEITVEVER